MDRVAIISGLTSYCCLLVLLTFHEFAHAWSALKLGDPTARNLGRVSLNPVVHMDLIGTVILPLAVVVLASFGSPLAGFIIGWGKPVPVDPTNLRHRRRDDTLVALAGPAMNFALAALLMGLLKVGVVLQSQMLHDVALQLVLLSLILCFFNLLPIPPLDGSHVLKNLIGMSEESYLRFCQFGFIAVIVAIQIPQVQGALNFATRVSYHVFLLLYRI